jgi:hypothetical protein
VSKTHQVDSDATFKNNVDRKLGDLERRVYRMQSNVSRFRVAMSAGFDVSSGVAPVVVPFNVVLHDLSRDYDLAAARFVAPASGYYDFQVSLGYVPLTASDARVTAYLNIDGADQGVFTRVFAAVGWSNDGLLVGSAMDRWVDAGALVGVSVAHNASSTATFGGGDQWTNFFAGRLVLAP